MLVSCAIARKRVSSQGEVSREWLQVGSQRVLLVRKRVKNVYLRVKPPDGRVEITAPVRLSQAEIRRFISSRQAWIERAQDRIARSAQSLGPGSAGPQPANLAEGTTSEERLREAKLIIEQQLPALLDKWVPIVGRGPSAISLRRMTTRWGSCTPATRRIRLNLELAWLDPKFLEYVLVHELTHLRASGHGALFQSLMSSYLPQWRMLRKELNQHIIV
ncbi:hypothetical protein KIMH_00360 [Bombiscardovia apis]|uniref:YgjP-like metallopeptidase domain-containing protein n=1 Tax=Bombiscardovia apis TaxID=2932182 RepID=A0ABM8BAR8_9BIFI|nr:SprT family zinc-dependent metalloprotease [Bombiscardovia apis]BDR53925.1 hypothetical protein KIMH_00360 [Bombiscardovia apis]